MRSVARMPNQASLESSIPPARGFIPLVFLIFIMLSVNCLAVTLGIINSTDPEGDAITYDFQVSIEPDFSVITAEQTCVPQSDTTIWTIDLPDSTNYYWRARACDPYSCSAYSQVWSFRIELDQYPPAYIKDLREESDGY